MPTKHGCTTRAKRRAKTPEWRAYVIWRAIKTRCYNPNCADFQNYGARGITVCERWQDFANFYQDMGAPPLGLTIERRDNSEGYGPGNCGWATRAEQSANRRNRREITFNGVTKSLTEWARFLGVPRRLLQVRMDRGWPAERLLNPQLVDTRFKKGNN